MPDHPLDNLSQWQPTGRRNRGALAAQPADESELSTKVTNQNGQRGVEIVVKQLWHSLLEQEIELMSSTPLPQKSTIGGDEFPDKIENTLVQAGYIPGTVRAD